MLKPLLSLKVPLTRSQNIVSLFKILPISYPITTTHCRERIKSILLKFFLILYASDFVNFSDFFGKLSSFAHCT